MTESPSVIWQIDEGVAIVRLMTWLEKRLLHWQ